MHLLEVFGDLLHHHVPAAVVAGRDGGVAFRAVQRAALEELLDAVAVGGHRGLGRQRERNLRLALFARPGRVLDRAAGRARGTFGGRNQFFLRAFSLASVISPSLTVISNFSFPAAFGLPSPFTASS